jgi:hypothetical protein
VLAGGDQVSAPNCLSFEDVVNRPARAAVRTGGAATQALMLAYPNGGAGLRAPVTLTHADMGAAVAALGDEVAAATRLSVQPISGVRGVARVLAALAAGVTLLPCPPGGDGDAGAAVGAA